MARGSIILNEHPGMRARDTTGAQPMEDPVSESMLYTIIFCKTDCKSSVQGDARRHSSEICGPDRKGCARNDGDAK
jgi:hypothetical protein